jgi:hypothetical protein
LPNPYTTPRFSVDYAVIDHLTLGGSIGFMTSSGSTDDKNTATGVTRSQDHDSASAFVLTPRVGYYLPFDMFGLWLRGGFTFYHLSDTPPAGAPGATTGNGFAIDLEPTFVINVTKGFGLYAGVVCDIPLSGSQSTDLGGGTSVSADYKLFNFGITTGMMGYL